MIIFRKIKWKNFLSTGNHFTEIQLDNASNTLVVGSNGAGKSTVLDALCFVLFGFFAHGVLAGTFRPCTTPSSVPTTIQPSDTAGDAATGEPRSYTHRSAPSPRAAP